VSYLVTGQPSFELGETDRYAETAANLVLPTLGTQVGRFLQSQFGDLIDWNLRFEAGATETSNLLTAGGREQGVRDFFAGARLGGEKEVLKNVYFSVSTGLCQLSPNNQASEELSFTDALGGKLEYRLPRLSVEAGIEPPSSARLCGRGGIRGSVQTPRQFGISLSRSWHF